MTFPSGHVPADPVFKLAARDKIENLQTLLRGLPNQQAVTAPDSYAEHIGNQLQFFCLPQNGIFPGGKSSCCLQCPGNDILGQAFAIFPKGLAELRD